MPSQYKSRCMATTIYEHFADRTRLPIGLDEVVSFFKQNDYVSDITISRTSKFSDVKAHIKIIDTDDGRIARIIYADYLDEPSKIKEKRIVLCKEIMHLADFPCAETGTIAQLRELVDSFSDGLPEVSPRHVLADHNGELSAAKILLPQQAALILLAELRRGRIEYADISEVALIPEDVCKRVCDHYGEFI
jgi:hypothetical protein